MRLSANVRRAGATGQGAAQAHEMMHGAFWILADTRLVILASASATVTRACRHPSDGAATLANFRWYVSCFFRRRANGSRMKMEKRTIG